jgi:hypothetical protein
LLDKYESLRLAHSQECWKSNNLEERLEIAEHAISKHTSQVLGLQKAQELQSQTQSSLDKSKNEAQRLFLRCSQLVREKNEIMDELVLTKVQLEKLSAPAVKTCSADDAFMQRQLKRLDLHQEEEDHALALAIAESEKVVADAPADPAPASPAHCAGAPCSKPSSQEASATIVVAPPPGHVDPCDPSTYKSFSKEPPLWLKTATLPVTARQELKAQKPPRPEESAIIAKCAPPPGCDAHVIKLEHWGLACSIHLQSFQQWCAACNEAVQRLDALAWAKEQPAKGAAESQVAAPTGPTAPGAAQGPAAVPAEEKPVRSYAEYQYYPYEGTLRCRGPRPCTGTWACAEERAKKFCSSSSNANAEVPGTWLVPNRAAG